MALSYKALPATTCPNCQVANMKLINIVISVKSDQYDEKCIFKD